MDRLSIIFIPLFVVRRMKNGNMPKPAVCWDAGKTAHVTEACREILCTRREFKLLEDFTCIENRILRARAS
jgi:hypothetical protein